MKLGDFGRSMGQLLTALGKSAVGQMLGTLTGQLAADLGSMDLRRRKTTADRLRKALADPAHELPLKTTKKLSGLITDATVEGRPQPLLAALDQAFTDANWTGLQRMAFLQKVMPDTPLAVKGVTLENVKFSTGTVSASTEPGAAAEVAVTAEVAVAAESAATAEPAATSETAPKPD